MPSGQDTDGNELQLEVIPEAESAEDTQTTNEGEGESEELHLDDSSDAKVEKLSAAEENAKRQEEAWLGKITAENSKFKVEDAPTWLHKRLNARLDAVGKTPETEEVVKKILTQEREAQEFQDLQKQIPKLTTVQAQELQSRFADLKDLGKVKALKVALDLMGLSQKMKDAEKRGIAKGRMSFPASGQPSVRKSEQTVGGVPLSVIQDDKKWNEMIRNGAGV